MGDKESIRISEELKIIKERISSNNEILNNKINYNTERFSPVDEKLNLVISNLGHIASNLDHARLSAVSAATIRLEKDLAITRLFNGQKMIVDSSDLTVAQCIMFDGFWEMWITNIFLKLLKPDDIVFDLGANFGYYTILAGSRITDGKIYSFEANPELIDILNKNLIVNGLKDIGIIENFAVLDKTGNKNLHIYKDSKGDASLQKGNSLIDHICNVRTISIDKYCSINNISKIDIIKLDVEGVEDKAYDGMHRIIKENDDLKIFIEYTQPKYKKPDIFFNKMKKDFPFIYYILPIPENKMIRRIPSFEDLSKISKNSSHSWQMILLSKTEVDI